VKISAKLGLCGDERSPPPCRAAPALPDDRASLHVGSVTPGAGGHRGAAGGAVGARSGQGPAGLSRARLRGGEPAGSGGRHRRGTAPRDWFGCLERRSGSHQPFLPVSPLVQDRNHRSPEVPLSRMCTHPSASSSPSSTTRQVRVPLWRWRRLAATP